MSARTRPAWSKALPSICHAWLPRKNLSRCWIRLLTDASLIPKQNPGRKALVGAGTEITPGSVDKAPHADVHHQAQSHKHESRCRTSVAHQRQGNPGDGDVSDHHGSVDQNVEAEYRGDSHHDVHPRTIFRLLGVVHQPQNQT